MNVEGSDRGLTHVLFLNLPRKSEEKDEILQTGQPVFQPRL
jgi:hypothetical protein